MDQSKCERCKYLKELENSFSRDSSGYHCGTCDDYDNFEADNEKICVTDLCVDCLKNIGEEA